MIPLDDEGKQGSLMKNKKRAREDGLPGPSRSRPKIKVKREEHSDSEDTPAQRIQALQVSQGVYAQKLT